MRPLDRANSSPNLRTTRSTQRHSRGHYDEYDDLEFFVIGDRVRVDGFRSGSVAYFGETEFGAGGDWVGVVLDEPTGNHDGKLHGRQYFQCAPNHGLFVRTHRLTRLSDSALGSSRTSSSCGTPLPSSENYQRLRYKTNANTGQSQTRSSSRGSTGSGLFDSCYYHGDDYRQEPAPTVASLTRKLRSIEARTQREMEDAYDYSRLAARQQAPIGILKHADSANRWRPEATDADVSRRSSRTNLSSRIDELNRRLRASSVSPANLQSVFNFRPKREQLKAYESDGRMQRSVNLSSLEPPRKGDRVLVRTERDGDLAGLLRYMGETNFATGEWAGVELDEPVGKNDGSVLGCRYFYCPQSYGLFVPATRVRKLHPEMDHISRQISSERLHGSQPSIFSSMRSTIKSPPPRLTSLSHRSGSSRSTTPSYNMDTPSLASGESSSMSVGRKPLFDFSRSTSSPLKTTNLDDFYDREKFYKI